MTLVDELYARISGDGEERVCTDITEQACEVVPRNFFLQVGARILTKTGDALSSPALVLAWLLPVLAAPAGLTAVLVPVREAGSLLPQMLLGGVLGRFRIRKWFWIIGCSLQGAAVIAMAAVAFTLTGALAGWCILGALAVFSISRGICSVTTKDLVGKTVPRTRRGRLSGLGSTISGVSALAVGLWFYGQQRQDMPPSTFGVLLLVAGTLWVLASILITTLEEFPGEAEGDSGGAVTEALASLRFLRDDPSFRNFCVARALLASTVLSMPFYVVLAREATGGESAGLGLLMVASSIATSVSAAAWGWLADRSSRLTLAAAGGFSALVGIVTFGVSFLESGAEVASWTYGLLFFLLGLGHTGIRLGRKTYLVDLAPSEKRASYVAVSNTLIGVVLALSGSLGFLSGAIGERGIILVFAGLGLAGAVLAMFLEETNTES